jgi:hypothetical protein
VLKQSTERLFLQIADSAAIDLSPRCTLADSTDNPRIPTPSTAETVSVLVFPSVAFEFFA